MVVKYILMKMIDIRKDNPRAADETKGIGELAESIGKSGLINPITIRELVGGSGPKDLRYELIAGYRRVMAFKFLGKTMIPANVLPPNTTERTVQETRAVENLQRKDLSVFEQAEEIKKLLSAGWPVDAVASHLGKSESWLRKRASVTNLSPTWKKAIKNSKLTVSQWPAQYLEMIGRMPVPAQERLADVLQWEIRRGTPELNDIQRALQSEQMVLAGAPFKIGDETLVPKVGSCLTCKKVSGRQPALFDDLVDRKGKPTDACLDKECYRVKGDAFLKRKIVELKKSRTDFLLLGSSRTDMKGIISPYSLEKAKKGDKKTILGIYVDFPDTGRTAMFLKGGRGTERIGGERKPKTLKERKGTITRRREALVCTWILGLLKKTKGETIARRKGVTYLLRVLAMIGTNHRADSFGESDWIGIGKMSPKKATDILWKSVLLVLELRLNYYQAAPSREMERIAGFLGLDIGKMREQARKDIPDPKAWTKMNADGSPKTKKKGGKRCRKNKRNTHTTSKRKITK